ncbi:MAG TPA: asparagine synthetase B [Streptosporangiaceae bacterium]|jgi:asparagine synthase (glutamine-hydrolysing)|nr:asparagine synthetase B [Streptosporangiaceae bacterium]
MCGIVGCLALALEADPDQNWVHAATERITHRGPDDEGFYSDPDVALGYKRLAIIDLSPGGHQPMVSGDGRYWMVYNGEIYNYVELGEELRQQGVVLRSSSDSEVLLETYARVGKDVVHRLRGMFAFAIWDTWTRELFCARDQFGIKPFFYAIDERPADSDVEPLWPASAPPWDAARGPSAGGSGAGGSTPSDGFPAFGPTGTAPWEAVPRPPQPSPPAPAQSSPGRGGRHAAGRGHPQAAVPTQSQPGAAGTAAPRRDPSVMLRFASERKALADPGELSILDREALSRYLAFQYVPPPQSLTPPVKVLPPGHALIARPGGSVDVFRYWRADLRPAPAPSADTAQKILAVMRDSIAVHLRSDAPLGAFLSGGIDSAAICALAAEHRPDLLTFTVGFEREGYSEIDRAQETAAALGVKSLPYVIGAQEFFTHLPRIIWHLDDPMADAAAIPLWFVAREASKHVKVVLSGEGSDELFGGYAIYRQPGVVRAGERLPDWGRLPLKRAAALIPDGVKGKGFLERTSTPLRRRYIGNAHVFIDEQADLVVPGGRLSGGMSAYAVTDPIYDQAADAGLDDVSTMQLVDINTWLAGDILVKADRMTMAHSLELRVPFLDREVMAVASRLAREEKIGAGTTKSALREAMAAVLPKAAAERAKLGFPVPVGHWLKGDAYGFAEGLLRGAQTQEWVDRTAALSLLERFRAGDPAVSWRHLWVLIVFSLWHQIYVERVYDPAALGWERVSGVGLL